MANTNLVFEVAFHGLMEMTSPQSALVPAPQPPWLPADHRLFPLQHFSACTPLSAPTQASRDEDLAEGKTQKHGLLPSWGSAHLAASSYIHSHRQGEGG